MVSRRTTVLLVLALGASVPFGLQLWRGTWLCRAEFDGTTHMLIPDPMGVVPCPAESPRTLSSTVVALTWMMFFGAVTLSGASDAADLVKSEVVGAG